MEAEVFLDAAYAIALASSRDEFHEKAVQLAGVIRSEGTKLVTTRAVILEIGNALSKQRYRTPAVKLLEALETDANVGIVALTETLYEQAFRLFRERMDKEWGIIDCISFVVMRERKILSALTTDEHFQQAGFRALLRKP